MRISEDDGVNRTAGRMSLLVILANINKVSLSVLLRSFALGYCLKEHEQEGHALSPAISDRAKELPIKGLVLYSLTIVDVIHLDAGDYLESQVYQNSSIAIDLDNYASSGGAFSGFATRFVMVKLED